MLFTNRYRAAMARKLEPMLAPAVSCFVLVLLFLAFPAQGQAHTVTAGPSFEVKAGFETRYRDGSWVPVQVTLRNGGPDFSGTLSLSASASQFLGQSNPATPSNYQAPISLANGAQKQVTLYVPLYYYESGIEVKLLDSSGNVIGSHAAPLNPLMPGDVFVGILSDQNSGFGPLGTVSLPNQGSSVVVKFLNAGTMPTMVATLKNFDAIVLDNFTTSNLKQAQLSVLQTWVNQGGTLITVGGPEWRRTLGALPAGLVPVTMDGTKTIPPGTSLLPVGGPQAGRAGQNSDSVQLPVTISTAGTMAQGDGSEVVLASRTTPLIVQAQRGQGTVIYLAFDPTLEPILGWQGARVLWESLLLRGLGEQVLSNYNTSSGGGSNSQPQKPLLAYRMSGLLQSLLPSTIRSPWWILGILFGSYVLVLGPVRLLLVRQLKRRDWSWRIVLSCIVIFSALSYGLASREKSTSILSNSITIAQLGQNGSPASITTYMGVFVPNEGNFQVYIPGNGLVQPSPDSLPTFQGGPTGPTEKSPTTIAPVQGGTDLNLQDVNIWTLHAILSEQNQQIHKGLQSQLTLQNGILVGTVTNTLGYALNDAFLLMPNDVLSLGHLAAGETKQVRLELSGRQLAPNETLTDLIAVKTHSPTYIDMPPQPQSVWQRHLATLYALDGEGFYGGSSQCTGQCSSPVPILPGPLGINPIANNSSTANSSALTIVATAGWPYTATKNNDPLLVPGSPATLIGWAENPLDASDNVTINGINPTGLHETLIEAPLSVDLAGSLNLPPNFIEGRLISAEGNNVQLRFPDVYTISTGSMTFDYVVPNARISSLTITEPSDINVFAQVGAFVDANSLPFRLYNWHSGSWDAISLSEDSFTTNNVSAYIGAGGRVLVQLNNQSSSLGTFAFGKPLLNVQGVAPDSLPANS